MQDILFEYLKKQPKIIIYGAGNNGRFLNWIFQYNQIEVHYFCDSNESLWGKEIDGTKCISPESLIKYSESVVIISPFRNEDIKLMLQKYSFRKVLEWDDVSFLQKKIYHDKRQAMIFFDNLLSKNLELREILDKNKKYKDIHKGKRCFILGNGPSLQNEDLLLLSDEIVFTVNQIARSPQFKNIHTNYHLWADPNFFKTDLKTEGDYALLELMKCLPDSTECFFIYDCMKEYVDKFELNKYINVNYYAVNSLIDEQAEIDFSGYICGASTVVQYAIRLAIYMGIKDIYLLGCDCTAIMNSINAYLSSYTFQSHCYEIDEYERDREKIMYRRLPLQAYYQSEIGVLDGYRSLKQYCVKRNIDIYNCTQGGLLEEFPRKNLKDILEAKYRGDK